MTNILAIETSCDDTAVAILNENGHVLSQAIYSQIKEFEPYGGVVPEIGSRAHIEQIKPITILALNKANLSPNNIDKVAATFGPGLVGPLLIGAQFAKGFALAYNIPLIPIHHIEGHIWAGFSESNFPSPPFIALIVSGGHTAIYHCDENFNIKTLGQTLDDAAGEAFDKIGRILGLGYPAGKKIDELALLGNKEKFIFPIGLKNSPDFNFSFSGLKTAAMKIINENSSHNMEFVYDICASLQEAIALALVPKTIKVTQSLGLRNIVLGGGVAANSRLREMLSHEAKKHNVDLFLPKKELCTDNAVMIGRAAIAKKAKGASIGIDVRASIKVEDKEELYL